MNSLFANLVIDYVFRDLFVEVILLQRCTSSLQIKSKKKKKIYLCEMCSNLTIEYNLLIFRLLKRPTFTFNLI